MIVGIIKQAWEVVSPDEDIGVRVGDMYMSLIYTCELSGANAFDYLNQLQLNTADVTKSPNRWMPWNYLKNIQPVSDAA